MGNLSFLRFLPLLLLCSCMSFSEVRISEVQSVELVEATQKGAVADIRVIIENPNGYAIKVTGADLKVLAGGQHIGNAKLDETVKIPGNSKEEHAFRIKADYHALLAGGIGGLMNLLSSGTIDLHITGDVTARAFLYTKKIPVDVHEKVPLGR